MLKFAEFFSSKIVLALVSFVTLAAAIWSAFNFLNNRPGLWATTIFAISLFIYVVFTLYSYFVRSENMALRGMTKTIHEINENYKNSLKKIFNGAESAPNVLDLLSEERQVLSGVCQRIENMMSLLIGRQVMATVKLIVNEDQGRPYAETYVRSIDQCIRDNPNIIKFEVGTGKNTGFDKALEKRRDYVPSHFYSADLKKHHGYQNERLNYLDLYRSTIVVPIRGQNENKTDTADEFDTIGFLCIDTMATNKLNDTYHIYIISSLANQMYNYISLMRGRFSI